MKKTSSAVSIISIIIFIGLILGLIWSTVRFSRFNIGGGGFSVQWIGLHSLITDDISPYSEQVTTQINSSGVFPSSFTKTSVVKFTSPMISGIVVIPFALIGNEGISHALWLILQLVAFITIIMLGVRLTNWKPVWYVFLLFTFFTTISFHVILPWLDGGLSIWVTLFLVLGLTAISHNRNEVAGIFLALTFMQPQMVILPVILILVWSASNKKRITILWFFITLIFLSILGTFMVPDWIAQYLRILYNFKQNFPLGSPIVLFATTWPGIGRQIGWLLSLFIAVVLLAEWRMVMDKDFRWLLWTVCLTIVISQWIGIPTIPSHFILMLLPLILVFAMLAERWPRAGNWVAVLISVVLFVWEWGLVYLDFIAGQSNSLLNLIIPLPVILLIGLYWVRWWAIKPRGLLVEEIKFGGAY